MFDVSTDVVLHGSISPASLKATLHSILTQSESINQVFILHDKEDSKLKKEVEQLADNTFEINWIISEGTLGSSLNRAFKNSGAEFILYIDNRDCELTLKLGALDLFRLTMTSNPATGMIYVDYELEQGRRIQEVRLLKHHIGRVRDNQDYGKAFFFRREALQEIGFADEQIKFNTLFQYPL